MEIRNNQILVANALTLVSGTIATFLVRYVTTWAGQSIVVEKAAGRRFSAQ
jgi:hypothetical protein